MKYTKEQREAVQAFRELKSLKIKAFAGAGKTTTLALMARQDHRKGLYLAYNREIAQSSRRKFPPNVVCQTAHSLAFGQLSPDLRNKATRQMSLQNPQLLRFLNRRVAFSEAEAGRYATYAKQALHWFCVSADQVPSREHVARALESAPGDIDPAKVLAVLPAIWEATESVDGELPLTFDGFMKLFQLSGKTLPFDYVAADECQDMFAAIQWIVRNSGAQQIWVGDPHQQIYEFNGAENAMRQLDDLDEYSLTMAFRFGEWLAELANPLLRKLGEDKVLRGNPEIRTKRGNRSQPVRIARGNATLLVELVKAAKQRRKVHVLGGPGKLESILSSAKRLMIGRPVLGGLFSGLGSWSEARERASSPGNHSLKGVVNLIDLHGLGEVESCVKLACKSEEEAQIVLTTVHQAKGREFPRVAIVDDFRAKPEFVASFGGRDYFSPPSEMIRLLYVALTRAESELFVPMTLAKRYNIDFELTTTQQEIAKDSDAEVVDPPVLPVIESPRPQMDRHPSILVQPSYRSVPIGKSVTTNPPATATQWDRWSMRLIIIVGIMANSIMLDFKGYIDLKSLAEFVGEKLLP